MRDLRGTIIICDHLYPSTGGKWVIAGTYTGCLVATGDRHIDFQGLNVYVRFQVEQAGHYDCELILIPRALPANAPVIHRQDFRVEVIDPLSPCEMGCLLPPFRVKCPSDLADPVPALIGVQLLLWLKVAGEDVASCPLNVIFRPNQGPAHADPSSQRSGS